MGGEGGGEGDRDGANVTVLIMRGGESYTGPLGSNMGHKSIVWPFQGRRHSQTGQGQNWGNCRRVWGNYTVLQYYNQAVRLAQLR